MMYVSGLDRATADRHFRWRAAAVPGGLDARPDARMQAELIAAHRAGRLTIETNDADRRVTVRWSDPAFGAPLIGIGDRASRLWRHPARSRAPRPRFDPAPIARRSDPDACLAARRCRRPPGPPPAGLAAALDALFANSPGIYGILIASPERVLAERYSAFGAPDRATPSWSMTKAITCTVIGRLIHEGWLGSVYDPAPAPLWRDPRVDPPPDHARPSAAHALGSRLSRAAMSDGNATHRLREQRGLSGRRRRVRRRAAFDRRDRAGIGVSLHQQRHQRARLDHPRSHRAPRPAVSRDAVRAAGRPAGHGQLPALG